MFGTYRLLLAFNVVLFHLLAIPAIGPLAVYSFFILSGYLMTHIMHNTYGYTGRGFWGYVKNRYYRLFPMYWLLLTFTLLLVIVGTETQSLAVHEKLKIPATAEEWFANIFMIFPELLPVEYPVRLLPASWALTIELFFYLLIGMGISRNKFLTTLWFLASVIYLVATIITTKEIGFGYGSIFTASLPFSMGAMLYFYKDNLQNLLANKLLSLQALTVYFVLNLVTVVYCTNIQLEGLWKVVFVSEGLNLVLSALMTLSLINTKTDNKVIRKIDTFLGDLSYPVYLVHWTGSLAVFLLLGHSGSYNIAYFLLSLVVTFGVSILVNHLLDKRLQKKRSVIKKQLTVS